MEFYTSKFGNVTYESDYVVGIYKDFISLSQYIELSNSVLDLLKQQQAVKYLADCGTMKAIEDETEVWAKHTWIDKAHNAGLKYAAFVVPSNLFGRMSLENIIEGISNERFQYKCFSNIAEAKDWLASCT